MRDDIVPPDTTAENKQAAAMVRYERLRTCTHRWHELAVSMGFDGVEEALLSLQAMKRGPRPTQETPDECECIAPETELADGTHSTKCFLCKRPV